MRRTLGLLFALTGACDGGDSVDMAPPAPVSARGPRVLWDLGTRPLPTVPLPNDIATSPDPTSPTGLRINASLVAPTAYETRLREGFSELDGWGTYMPLTVSFDEDLDQDNLVRRMRNDDNAFADDAVYLVNLRTGVPVPLDMGDGNIVYTARNRDGYYPNDPRGGQSNLLLETVDEDLNGNGAMDPGEDTNFDGVLNRAAVWPPRSDPNDNLTTWWEPDSRTLILRPLLPLEERTRYAVVVTSRLTGRGGRPVRSPFPTVAHPSQAAALEALDGLVRGRANYYGNLGYRPRAGDGDDTARVVFAWSFTTQTTVTDMLEMRRGLYGQGPFAQLAATTPDLRLIEANSGVNCDPSQRDRPHIVRGRALERLVQNLAEALDVTGVQRDRLIENYRYVDYVVTGTYRVPYPMGDPRSGDHHDRWNINTRTGRIEHLGTDTVQFTLTVPKAIGDRRPPFPVMVQGHGYTGSNIDALGFGPMMAAQGVASMSINGPGHGLVLPSGQLGTITGLLRGLCLSGVTDGVLNGRARDLNGDGVADSGADFWTAYVFHTRDQVRQLVLDHMQLIRAFRGFDGRALTPDDFNHNGRPDDLAGDFNGDGVVDVGGPSNSYFATGGSLGGIMSMVLGSADASVRAAIPISGGGGLTDIGIRSTQGGIKEAVVLRIVGPLIMGIPARDFAPSRDTPPRTRTSCASTQLSLRFLVPDLNDTGQLEFACADVRDEPGSPDTPGGPPPPTVAPGDDVLATNIRTGEVRCARAGADARFRIGIASNVDDALALTIYRGAAITDYGTCAVRDDARVKSTVTTMRVVEGDCTESCGHIPPAATEGTPARRWAARGAPLRSPAEGMGLRRQTPQLRRFMLLAQAALDAADPISFAPLYYRARPADHAPHAVLVLNTAGDQAVPVSTGNAFARAVGAIPFLSPDSVTTAPELADFATPASLWARYNRTPNRELIRRGVYEGLASIGRFPIPGRDQILFDADDLDEGASRFGEQFLTPPMRLVRRATAASNSAELDAAWAPTLAATSAPWRPDNTPVAALLNAYIRPEGVHSFSLPDPRLPWDHATYLINLMARFFATNGADLIYRSRPATHQCAATSTCDFLSPRPATQ